MHSYLSYSGAVHLPLPVDVHPVPAYTFISLSRAEDQLLLYELLYEFITTCKIIEQGAYKPKADKKN